VRNLEQNNPDTGVSVVRRLLTDPNAVLIAQLHDIICTATHSFWQQRQGASPLLPITTGAVSSPMGQGSDSTPVEVLLGGHPTYLADSMQFHLELAVRILDAPCYYLMPSFRGEDADRTHLPQYFHSEAELDGGLDDVIATAEDYVRHLVAEIVTHCADGLSGYASGTDHLQDFLRQGPLPRLTFDDAAAVVPEYVQHHAGWRTLGRDGEEALMRKMGGALWLTEFDHLSVPFYQAFRRGQRDVAANADLLLGCGEVIGAGERHPDAANLTEALGLHGVDDRPYRWYVEMKRLRPRQTAGFGLGVERLLMWVLGCDDIRQVQLIPRHTPHDLSL
jgi:asparaginyl-tRNA synthetase